MAGGWRCVPVEHAVVIDGVGGVGGAYFIIILRTPDIAADARPALAFLVEALFEAAQHAGFLAFNRLLHLRQELLLRL